VLGTLVASAPGTLGCARKAPPTPPPPPHRGPVVLITLDALRADVVGALDGRLVNGHSLTPHFDGLIAAADWAGRAVAPSSWTVPSMASIMTGLQPWQHGALDDERAVLRDDLDTLAEVFRGLGFDTAGYRSNVWLTEKLGWAQGFDVFRRLGKGYRAQYRLAHLSGGPELVWVHVLPPHAPYLRDDDLARTLGQDPAALPERIEAADLERFYDPRLELPEDRRRVLWTLYGHHVARADRWLGVLLTALRSSGQWDRALVIVTSDHGEEFGEPEKQGGHRQTGHGGNLRRVLLEVPLAIKLPRGFGRELAVAPGERVASHRLWATLVDAAGGEVPAEVASLAPSLFGLRPPGILSELYNGNGVNRFSWIEEELEGLAETELQLLWESSFADPEPEYFQARYRTLGGDPRPPLAEPAAEIFGRLDRSFARTPPLTGRGDAPRLTLLRWRPSGATEPVADPEPTRRLARALRDVWSATFGAEQTPGARFGDRTPALSAEEEEALRSLGYVAGKR